jgi:hypothetical protein
MTHNLKFLHPPNILVVCTLKIFHIKFVGMHIISLNAVFTCWTIIFHAELNVGIFSAAIQSTKHAIFSLIYFLTGKRKFM